MANVPLSVIDAAEDSGDSQPRALPPSAIELNLLLEWPAERSRQHWIAVLAASVALHICFFFIALNLPSFVARAEPESRVIVRHVPLYLPPDVLTQRAPNRNKLSKNIDLADLLAAREQQARRAAPNPSTKHFELPKQAMPAQMAKNSPQILPEAPQVPLNQTPAPSPGALNGIGAPAPPPPAPPSQPFQNIGSEAPPNPHPALAPPKASVQAAINGLAQNAIGRHLIISDDNPSHPLPGTSGSAGQLGAQHSAVELQSDPQGADFKPYLTQILAIVRANWRRVIPASARMGTLRGRTVLEFEINRDGSIPKLVTADSSGSEPLDRAAVAGLSMSNPLPPLPSDYKGFQVRLAFSFSYNMPAQ